MKTPWVPTLVWLAAAVAALLLAWAAPDEAVIERQTAYQAQRSGR